jgi:hypothetical protein
LIEVDCEGGGPASGSVEAAADPTKTKASGVASGGGGGGASRSHIHSTVRTPNGNDYGFDLLKEHLTTHPHE